MFNNIIKIEDKDLFQEFLYNFEHYTSGLTFTSLFMWKDLNNFRFDIINDFLCISGNSHLEYPDIEPFLFPPLPKDGVFNETLLGETLDILKDIFEDSGYVFNLRLLPFHMMDIFEKAKPNKLCFLDDRDNYDYVYYTKDLIELAGKKYHSKRNHLNYFVNNYPYKFVPFTKDMTEECLALNRKISANKIMSSKEMLLMNMEEQALKEAFYNFDECGFIGGVIKINGNIEAFSLGSVLDRKTICVHIEKANAEFRGIYQAINNEFCKCFGKNYKYINREEDMGLPGLRKAKLSYRPVFYTEKYICCFKDDI